MTDTERMEALEQEAGGRRVVVGRQRVTGLFYMRVVAGSTKGSATVREAIDKMVEADRRKALGLKR